MNVDIKFHCEEGPQFDTGTPVRAFIYKDYSIEMHNHDFFELNIVMSGTGTHCIEDKKFKVQKGDVFMISPMLAHAYTDTENLDVYHILLQKNYVFQNAEETKQVKGFLQFMEIEPFLRTNYSDSCFLHLNQSQLLQLKSDLDIVSDRGNYPWDNYYAMKLHTIWKILYWFSGLLNEQLSDSKSFKVKYERQIFNALEYIHEHYGEKISIESLCEKFYMTRSTFLRSFNEICGVSPIIYLNRYRCKQALLMLDTSELSKTEIAHRCGFYDLSHMERMLKNKQYTSNLN